MRADLLTYRILKSNNPELNAEEVLSMMVTERECLRKIWEYWTRGAY